MIDSVVSQQAAEPVGHFPHARRVGNLLFLSGIGPRERGNPKVPGNTMDALGDLVSYEFATQVRAVFRNVSLILHDADLTLRDVVDVTAYLVNMRDDFATFNRMWTEYFPDAPPCRTTVEVRALPTLYAATSMDAHGGEYIGPDGFMEMKGSPVVVQPRPHGLDQAVAERLWTVSEMLTGVTYSALS